MSFINNSCNSLFGGGTGLLFDGIKQLVFIGCFFINNEAFQNQSNKRPTEDENIIYFNGDGGGIQIGYYCSSNNIDIIFDTCIFKENKAKRHGGAIAIQTLENVKIINCIFERNIANYQSNNLLFDDNFNSKKDGRGGAIYINPYFHADSLDCSSKNSFFMKDVCIENCTFTSNKGFDGHAIFIQGFDFGTKISILNNDFLNNFNKETLSKSSIIESEICNQSRKQLIENNFFKNEENGEIININEYNCPDNDMITESLFFTKSTIFSESNAFTKSTIFSESLLFTKSTIFSESNTFTKSTIFSESIHFTKTKIFSESNVFTKSIIFSESNAFSKSTIFNKSNIFTKETIFSESNAFSKSTMFSESNFFTKSEIFSESTHFMISLPLFLTSSNFTQSQDITYQSNQFQTKSEKYSEPTFLMSHEFSNENNFITSTEIFTTTETFNYSQSNSIIFQSITFSRSYLLTYLLRKSVSFSLSLSNSFMYSYILIENGDYSLILTQSDFYFYFPYIINIYSPSYSLSYIPHILPKNRKISPEQLIGIVCGSISILFFILGVIILAIRRQWMKNSGINSDSISSSSGQINISKKVDEKNFNQEEEILKLNSDDSDLNFWL